MKKFIFIVNALDIIAGLLKGEKFKGVLYMDKDTHVLTFKAWNRKAPKHRRKDELVHQLESGWLKESPEKYKLFISVYKKLGLARILSILDRETKEAKTALFDKELIESI